MRTMSCAIFAIVRPAIVPDAFLTVPISFGEFLLASF